MYPTGLNTHTHTHRSIGKKKYFVFYVPEYCRKDSINVCFMSYVNITVWANRFKGIHSFAVQKLICLIFSIYNFKRKETFFRFARLVAFIWS